MYNVPTITKWLVLCIHPKIIDYEKKFNNNMDTQLSPGYTYSIEIITMIQSRGYIKLKILVNRGKQLKKLLKCGSLIGVVFPAFKHDFEHFEWAHVWSSQ